MGGECTLQTKKFGPKWLRLCKTCPCGNKTLTALCMDKIINTITTQVWATQLTEPIPRIIIPAKEDFKRLALDILVVQNCLAKMIKIIEEKKKFRKLFKFHSDWVFFYSYVSSK